MRDDSDLERRVEALEREVADLRQLASVPTGGGWIEAIANRRRDREAFAELAKIVDENREADRRAFEAGEAP